MKFVTPIRLLTASVAAAALCAGTAAADEEDGKQLKMKAAEMLDRCQEISESCATTTQNAEGILVFPEVLKADLIVGGAGGNGVLMQNDQVVGYYDIGKASAGLQAGIDEFATVYVFKSADTLADLTDGDEWEIGVEAGATIITANADAVAETGDPAIYVFDADGLNAEIDVTVMRIWQDDENAEGGNDAMEEAAYEAETTTVAAAQDIEEEEEEIQQQAEELNAEALEAEEDAEDFGQSMEREAEETGYEMENAAEATGDQMQEWGDDAENEVEETGYEMENAAEEAGNEMEEFGNDVEEGSEEAIDETGEELEEVGDEMDDDPDAY